MTPRNGMTFRGEPVDEARAVRGLRPEFGADSGRPGSGIESMPGRGASRIGGTLTVIGVVLSVIASSLTGIFLEHTKSSLPYRTVKEAFDHGDGAAYAPSALCAASQVLWLVLVLVGFVLLIIGFARGHRRTWVWILAVLGPVGLMASVAVFVATVGLAAAV